MNRNDIYVVYGSNPKEMAKKILHEVQIEDLIGDRKKKIGIKPNLVVAKPAQEGATTHPEMVAGAIEYLKDKGYEDISVIEGSWVGDRTSEAFDICGYKDLKRKYGVKLVDTQKDSFSSYDCKGVNINICDSAMEVDFMINMPVLKGHCQTGVTCALKNNKGVITNQEKRKFHTMGLHKPIAHLNTVAKNDFILVDGICGDLNFEEGGNPVSMNRIIAATDPVLCDSYVCELMGYSLDEVPYIKMAEKLGVGSSRTEIANILEINEAKNTTNSITSKRKVKKPKFVEEVDACSACYGSLLRALDRLDETGDLRNIKDKICIGQGFKGKNGNLGIGICTSNFDKSLLGCPPRAIDIVDFLKNI
ncbi:DUF362 domain-containing protein [Alkalibacter saccharofermentans]|uniref:Uncharacterized conserved protein, DUF362 family n=1 Tax=Alkalibacter saccharofermentans DSM 14828 TaxID=1120975 RepID=A0A1M4YVX1_9FIRM|nr:DUF362 domain-containing protein [Alkalibacter saccharofermentans]SHF09943.1 Uncharacterized conserved protein, DUF362 family [Alkalibacter saccharofermentans DSM 14828]